jgi:hypothetical protein
MLSNAITRHWIAAPVEYAEDGSVIPDSGTVKIKTPQGWTRLPGEKGRTIISYKTVPKFYKHKGRKLNVVELQLEIT